MAINPTRAGFGQPILPPGPRDRGAIDESAPPTIRSPAYGAVDPNTPRRATEEVPPEAPPGTDPALWSVLTHEERSFFARARPAGPVTYTATTNGRTAPDASHGSRIDLRG